VADYLGKVKADEAAPAIAEEFFRKEARLREGTWTDD